MDEVLSPPHSFQFRLSTLFLLTSLVAAFLAGFAFVQIAQSGEFPEWLLDVVAQSIFLVAPITAGTLLLVRRSAAAVPMATAMFICAGVSFYYIFVDRDIVFVFFYVAACSMLLGSALTMLRLLLQKVTALRVALAIVSYYYLGVSLRVVAAAGFPELFHVNI